MLSPGWYASSATNRCDDKGQLLPLGTNGDFDQFEEGGVEIAPLQGKARIGVLAAPLVEAFRRHPDPLQVDVSCWTELR